MNLLLSPKDNLNKIILSDVETFALEGDTLLVVFDNGRTRNYPLIHLWYYESHVDSHQSSALAGENSPTFERGKDNANDERPAAGGEE